MTGVVDKHREMYYFFLVLLEYLDGNTLLYQAVERDYKVVERFKMFHDKITVFELNFSRTAFENLSDKGSSKLSETQFAITHKVKSTMRL